MGWINFYRNQFLVVIRVDHLCDVFVRFLPFRELSVAHFRIHWGKPQVWPGPSKNMQLAQPSALASP